jgi:membrane protease YdiL (CAAX protease family)
VTRTISPPPRCSPTGAVIIVAIAATFSSLVLLGDHWKLLTAALAALTLAAAGLRAVQGVHLGLLSTLALAAFQLDWLGMWPLPLLAALGLYGLAVALVPALRRSLGWLRWGTLDRDVFWMIVATVAISSTALVLWTVAIRPELSTLRESAAGMPAWLLPLAALAFAMLNALAEEAYYRGVLFHALDAALGRSAASLAVQAAAFGVMHLQGFPSGWLGVAMATVYGLMLGLVRWRAKGMFAPWLAHVFADVTIAALVLLMA